MIHKRTLLAYVLILVPLEAFAKRGNGRPTNITNQTGRNVNLTINSLEITYINPEYIGPDSTLELHDQNELSFRFNILKTLPADTQAITYTSEKTTRGDYIPSITIRENLCDEYIKDGRNLPLYKCFHYHFAGIKECPFQKTVLYRDIDYDEYRLLDAIWLKSSGSRVRRPTKWHLIIDTCPSRCLDKIYAPKSVKQITFSAF